MTKLLQYETTYGKSKKVVYWRAFDAYDESAQARADELNALDTDNELDAYNQACAEGKAGKVKTKVTEIDG